MGQVVTHNLRLSCHLTFGVLPHDLYGAGYNNLLLIGHVGASHCDHGAVTLPLLSLGNLLSRPLHTHPVRPAIGYSDAFTTSAPQRDSLPDRW